MPAMEPSKRKVVLGLGNLLLGDDGFGIHALEHLQAQWAMDFPVEWIDGGVLGLRLLPIVESCSHLLVLDGVEAGLPEGSVVEMANDEIPIYAGMKMSEHQMGFQEVLTIARLRGHYPAQLHLVGIQAGSTAPSLDLSPAMKEAFPEATRRAVGVLKEWFSPCHKAG